MISVGNYGRLVCWQLRTFYVLETMNVLCVGNYERFCVGMNVYSVDNYGFLVYFAFGNSGRFCHGFML